MVTFGLALGLVGMLGVAGVLAQSSGATFDASPDSLELPERSLWVDILGDVTFIDNYSDIADVGENGLFVLEERRNLQPYRLLIIGKNDLYFPNTAEEMAYLTGENGERSFVYAEGGEINFKRNGSGNITTVEGADLIIFDSLAGLKTDHPDIARWLQEGLEQSVAELVEAKSSAGAANEDPLASLVGAVRPLPNEAGHYSLHKAASSASLAHLPRLARVSWSETNPEVYETIIYELRRGLHLLAHGLISDYNAMTFVQDSTRDYTDYLDETSYALMLWAAEELATESAKAKVLIAVAGVLPEDAELKSRVSARCSDPRGRGATA